MATIECPICRDDIRGSNSSDLSQNLKMHLADMHGMTNLRGGSAQGSGGSAYPMGSRSGERTYATGGSSMTSERQYSTSRPGTEEQVSGRASDVKGRTEEKGRDVGRSMGMGGREEATAAINCPLCGKLLRAEDEDDLSDDLEDHMKDVHDIKPKLTARMSRS